MKHHDDLNQWLRQFGEGEVVNALTGLCDLTAFLMMDSDLRIVEWSRGAEKLSGYPRSQMLGEPCLEAFKIAESEQVNQARVKLLRADGKRIEIDLYSQAAEETRDPAARDAYRFLVDDEIRHHQELKTQWEKLAGRPYPEH